MTLAVSRGLPEQTISNTRLTVLIPTHNRPELLREAVRSALVDLPPDAEILVIDDASEHPAEHVLGTLVAEDR